MTNNSPGTDMIDLQNAIDSEFEVAKMANICGRSTNMLFNRVDGLSGKQSEIKSFLETLDAQIRQAGEIITNRMLHVSGEVSTCTSGTSTTMIDTLLSSVDNVDRRLSTNDSTTNNAKSPSSTRSRSVSTERRSISGGKDSPIIIDDEVEEVFPRTISRNSRTSSEDSATPSVNIRPQPMLLPAEREAMAKNARRRPKIIEKEPQIAPVEDRDNGSFSIEPGVPLVPRELSLASVVRRLSSNEISQTPSPDDLTPYTRMSAAITVPTSLSMEGNGSSTESASSSLNERSQSPIELDDFQASQGDVVSSNPVSTSVSPVILSQRTLRSKEPHPSFASHIISRRPHSPTDYIVGSRVLGKRSSDIWFPGEITKIMPDKQRQTKYTIKYDKGQKGVLSLNHICPEAPAMVVDLCVGSRVVGLYGRLDIWYAGIVAEMPCSDNRKRFLVFYDDGFAQYLSAKKLHKVHHKGKNVWEDVTEHSRDFIQEYLEDYPSRPMLHVRVGQWIRTEWKGQWLRARVLSVDGSLIKMLFQIDNRSEWIYRGSTRLDPLYRALVLGEKTTSAKARSRKLTRNASSKGNAPYIEYNTTKPSFGISPYSKTDPEGIQQLQLEEQRKRTQLQQQETTDTSKLQPTRAATTVGKTAKQKQNESLKESKQRVKTMPAVVKTEAQLVPKTELVIESTYSCIQASTLRKRTGVSLVNNIIFKANQSSEEEQSPMPTPAKPPSANITPLPHHPPLPQDPPLPHHPPLPHDPPNLKTVDQVKPKGKSGQWKAPWLNLDQRNKQRHVDDNVVKPEAGVHSNKPRDVASILKNKLDASSLKEETATVKPAFATPKLESVTSLAGPHTCSSACAQYRSYACIDHLRHNPLAMPIFLDWKREVVKRRGKTSKRDVYYRTPCHRRLRNMAEVLHYLTLTRDTSLVIDQFSFDWRVRTKDTVQSLPVIDDISNGQEKRPLPAVNEVDNERPPDVVKYVSERTLAAGVDLCKDPGFMVCCDCEDNCSDSSKCACIQLTIQGCKAMDGKNPEKATYQYKRLKDCVQTGIYECNSQCSCNKSCLNRLVQNGIQIRLEIFKTENRGWGVRAVDDVPAGTFICTYAGYLLNEDLANQEGRDYGDEYMAELDYIEVAEKAKEGYESGVSDFEEDDNVIHEMLTFDENLPDSENSDHSSFENEVLEQDDDDDEDDDDEEEEEDDDESDDDVASSSDNCSLNSGDENPMRQIRKALRSSKRKKVFKSQQKKKRGTASEESLVVERESKANVLSRLGDPLMCILALKRNGNDLKKSARFLRKLVVGNGEDGETMDMNDKHCAPMNGVSFPLTTEIAGVENGRPIVVSTSDFDLDDLSDDALADIHGSRDRLNSASNERALDEEKRSGVGGRDKRPPTKEVGQQGSTLMEGLETNDVTSSPNNGITVEDVGITKEDVPELLSAEDLKRLAASEPKSMEPPLLSKAGEPRRGNVLDETIEKLKKRVVTSDSSFSDTQIVSEKNATTENTHEICDKCLLGEQVNMSSEAIAFAKAGSGYGSVTASSSSISEKSSYLDEKELDVLDDDKRSVQSESSLLSRNSSSVSQSVSSRCSSPTMEVSNRLVRNSGKVQRMEKTTQKDDKSEPNNSSLTKHVKTRSLFKEEHCYVIDAKTYGNCGRFLNHSCTPNMFVQNVFVDTHDLRFPRVAFFAQQNIKAGTELSWDYMYEVGSVRDKVLHCLCGSSECRGRLL